MNRTKNAYKTLFNKHFLPCQYRNYNIVVGLAWPLWYLILERLFLQHFGEVHCRCLQCLENEKIVHLGTYSEGIWLWILLLTKLLKFDQCTIFSCLLFTYDPNKNKSVLFVIRFLFVIPHHFKLKFSVDHFAPPMLVHYTPLWQANFITKLRNKKWMKIYNIEYYLIGNFMYFNIILTRELSEEA